MKFEFPQMTVLKPSTREAAYGPETGHDCTWKDCCYQGK